MSCWCVPCWSGSSADWLGFGRRLISCLLCMRVKEEVRSRRVVSSPPPLPEPVVTASTELSQPSDLISRHFGRNLYLTESIRDVWTKVLKAQYVRITLLLNSRQAAGGSTSAGSCYLFNKMDLFDLLFLHLLFHFPSSILTYSSFHLCEPAAVICCCVETPGDNLKSESPL